MKHRLQITLEDAANELLNQQENKSKYIEDLILKQDTSDLTTEIKRLAMLVDGLVDDISNLPKKINYIKQPVQPIQPAPISTGEAFVPKPPDPELGYPCCSGRTPCKHWVFDGLDGVWKNTLTGKTRDA